MKRIILFGMVSFALSVNLTSCSSNEEEVSPNELSTESKIEAIKDFEKSFNSNFANFIRTRAVIADASEEKMDSTMAAVGNEVCEDLIEPSEELLTQLGFTDDIFEEVIEEMPKDDTNGQIPMRELKCFTALVIYECYKDNKVATRIDYMDIAGCIGIGSTVKQLFDMPARKIATFAAKKLAGRLVPYVGWGWGIASAVHCLSRL